MIVQIAPIGIIALGMMFAIITKGIDLSVGATVAVAAVVGASLAHGVDAEPLPNEERTARCRSSSRCSPASWWAR